MRNDEMALGKPKILKSGFYVICRIGKKNDSRIPLWQVIGYEKLLNVVEIITTSNIYDIIANPQLQLHRWYYSERLDKELLLIMYA